MGSEVPRARLTTLLRVGPVDERVRTIAAALRVDPVVVRPDRQGLDAVLDSEPAALLLSSDVPALNALVLRLARREQATAVTVGWIPDLDRDSSELGAGFGLPHQPALAADAAATGPVRQIGMVRDDHGGVLLHRGRLTPGTGMTFGAQSYHDDAKVTDGKVRRIEVRPDHTGAVAVSVDVVRRGRFGRAQTARSTGRSIQVASDPVVCTVDGVPHPRPVTKWTWYADPRQHWLLRTPGQPG